MTKRKIVIIGAVAAGTSAAAKLRRLDEGLEITIYERDKYISYASCGLPYYVSEKIKNLDDLLVNSVSSFSKRFNLNVKIMHEVLKIEPEMQSLTVRNINTNEEFVDKYDYLLITTGTQPAKLAFFNNEKNIYFLKTIEDAVILKDYISSYVSSEIPDSSEGKKEENDSLYSADSVIERKNKTGIKKTIKTNALIIGAGFIGLELLEAFSGKNLKTVIVEKTSQILPSFDTEVTDYAEDYLKRKGIEIYKNCDILRYFTDSSQKIKSVIISGDIEIQPDFVFMGIGVRPENQLAQECGIETGIRGALKVDSTLKTNFENIYAAGDCVEVEDLLTNENKVFCLASIASKQGRIVAENISRTIKEQKDNKENPELKIKKHDFKGSIATSIIKIFDLQIGKTGLSFKEAKRINANAAKIETHALSHAGYYPGAQMLHMVTVFDKVSGELLGFEAVGKEAVDKKTDIMAVSIYAGQDIRNLAEYDLSYHPSCGSAKDSVNIIGMIAQNLFDGEIEFIDCEDLKEIINNKDLIKSYQIIDVRNPQEFKAGFIEGSELIPLNDLRENFTSIDKSKEIIIYCKTGYRAYVAYKILKNSGFKKIKCLNGSYHSWKRTM